MEMTFAKWPSALKMRLRLASASGPFARQPEQLTGIYFGKSEAIQLASGERRDERPPLSRAAIREVLPHQLREKAGPQAIGSLGPVRVLLVSYRR